MVAARQCGCRPSIDLTATRFMSHVMKQPVTSSCPRPSRNVWKDFVKFHDALNVPREDLDNYMAERPMNQPVEGRSVFEDEQ